MTESTLQNPFEISLKNRYLAKLIASVLGTDRLAEYYRQRPEDADQDSFLQFTLSVLGITLSVEGETNLQAIPKKGPLLIVANHPLGGLEGVALASILLTVRPDLKVLTNELLRRIPELKELFIGVDILSAGATKKNAASVLQAHRHLEQGGALLLFPAGVVSAINIKRRRIEDQSWNRLAGSLLVKHKAACLPVYINGQNSKLFYCLGLIHPRLRTLSLARELANKRGMTLPIIIGELISASETKQAGDAQGVTHYLRMSTEILGAKRNNSVKEAINIDDLTMPAADGQFLDEEIAEVHDCLLIEHEDLQVYCVPYNRLPIIMKHIGIAREITFRMAGEGTGQDVDIDRFDPHYLHLFIWDKQARSVVGGYRIGKVDEIVSKYGLDALYSRSLYRFDRAFLRSVGPALEIGRSFVHPDYQRHPLVLDLLWRGIGAYVAKNLKYHILFGAVSISREHSDLARELIAECMLESFCAEQKHLQQVRPITPLKTSKRVWTDEMLTVLSNVKVLNKLIGRCDPGKTIPPLLRHYLSLNGRFLCFSLNTGFNDSLDGLMIVDLSKTPRKYVQRYLGKEAARKLLDEPEALV